MVYSPSDVGGVNEDYVLSGNFDTCGTVFVLSESFGGTTRSTWGFWTDVAKTVNVFIPSLAIRDCWKD